MESGIVNELKFAFVHLPKTGGRAIQAFLDSNFKRSLALNNGYQNFTDLAPQDFCCFDLLHGHFGYETIPLPRIFKYITFLRDPIERTVSEYNHLMGLETVLEVAETMRKDNWSFHDFIMSNHLKLIGWIHAYTGFLGGYNQEEEWDFKELIVRASVNLCYNFDFVGITERMDESIALLKKKYGLKGEIKSVGKTPQDKKTKITDKDLEEARTVLKPDILIYETAKEIFDDALRKIDK